MPGAVRLSRGDARLWEGEADLVFTHPYGPIPECLKGRPMLLNLFGDKLEQATRWAGADLEVVSRWGKGLRNTLYCANVERRAVDLTDLVEDNTGLEPGKGWFPLELPMRVLRAYGEPGWTVWDGFMGRGTVGRACQIRGLSYIGIDIDPQRVEIARKYLGMA